MGYWRTRGLRGNSFEEAINYTNEVYRKKNLALVQKIPTPIKPVQLDNKNHTISLAYFEKKSIVDYIGVAQGIPLCFDAKETNLKRLPLSNIHQHQIDFMDDFQKQQGISFLLVHFKIFGKYFYLPFKTLKKIWDESARKGKKSIGYSEFESTFEVFRNENGIIHYLEAVRLDIALQQKN